MPEHTPTPWTYGSRYVAKKVSHSDYDHIAMIPDGREFAEGDQWDKDAAFIVKAVNCHDELVAALQRIAVGAEGGQSFSGTDCRDIAVAALQAAGAL